MAVSKNSSKYAVKVDYKPDYDITGDFATLKAYSQTFSNIKESASVDDIKAFADALMNLTIYRGAPYKVYLVDTSNLLTV